MQYRKLKEIIKKNIKFYFFSDYIKELFIKKKFHPNSQANWMGETLTKEVAKNDRIFFEKSSLDSMVLTVGGVTKNVGLIKNFSRVDCTKIDRTKNRLQLSFWSKYWDKKSLLRIKINKKDYNFRNIKNINNPAYTEDYWFDICIEIDDKFDFIEIFCENENIYFAKPITFNSIVPPNVKDKDNEQKNHVIVIVLDGVVAEFLNNKNQNKHKNNSISPNINSFFKNYFSTNYAFSTSEWTLPAISSFFSGMRTSEHKISKPDRYNFFSEMLPSLPELLNQNGYKTQFFSTGNRTTPLFGFNRGFDRTFYSHPHGITKSKFNTNEWIGHIIDFLNVYKNDKTFSYVHFPNTHQDWMTPGFKNYTFSLSREDSHGFDLREIEEKDAENVEKLRIYEIDLFLGNLFNFIEKNLSENTSVILTGDHGSPFYKKYNKKGTSSNSDNQKQILNYRRTNVPFFCRSPIMKEKNSNVDKSQLVSGNIDLSKTILDICRINSDKFHSGISIYDKNKRNFLISESIYKEYFEIAIIKREYSYFERFKFDENTYKIIEKDKSKKMFFKTKNINENNLIDQHNTDEYKLIMNEYVENNLGKLGFFDK
jgi:arylsulfatase A-like enzyme